MAGYSLLLVEANSFEVKIYMYAYLLEYNPNQPLTVYFLRLSYCFREILGQNIELDLPSSSDQNLTGILSRFHGSYINSKNIRQ